MNADGIRTTLAQVLAQLHDLRGLVRSQIRGRNPKLYAEHKLDIAESLLRALAAMDSDCDACGIERAIVWTDRGSFCGHCAEEIISPEPERGPEQRGSTCSPGCGWCGACS